MSRTALDAQPLPRFLPRNTRAHRRIVLSDANVAVTWLNAAQAAKERGSYERVVLIRQQLAEFRCKRAELHEYWPDPEAWQNACRELEEQRGLVRAGKKARKVQFPGGRKNIDSPEYRKLYEEMESLHSALNEELCGYAFRPRITYLVAADVWQGGMVPDDNSRWFQIKVAPLTTISEPDAVLALLRLNLLGEIDKVRRCEHCAQRWLVAKRNSRFCTGSRCREAAYAKDSKYLDRKAKNQREYRKRLKTRRSEW